ncbi:MAG: hypothetical protein ACYDBQ_08200 [Thermoplasmatota archaeon]
MRQPYGRIALTGALLAAFLLVAIPPHALAGTQASPEVTDAVGDATLTQAGQNYCAPSPVAQCAVANADLKEGWIDGETGASVNVHIQLAGAPTALAPLTYTYTFHMVAGIVNATAIVTYDGTGKATGSGVARNASLTGDTFTFTVLRTDLGSPAAGAALGKLYIESQGTSAAGAVDNDRAPNQGAAPKSYNFTMATSSSTSPSPTTTPTNSTTSMPTSTTTTKPPTSTTAPSTTTTPAATTTTTPPATTATTSPACAAGSADCLTAGSNLGFLLFALVFFLAIAAVSLVALFGRWAL